MFIDEKTQINIFANLEESVSSGTLRPQDLIPDFVYVIRDTPEYQQIAFHPNLSWELKVIFDPTAYNDDDERWDSEEISYFLNEELFDILNNYAPEGYYFGSHPGNGSDFGYWKIED